VNNTQRGYTLVEMVIALALTGLLMAVLGGALYGVGQGFARATTQAEAVDRVFRVSQSLRSALSRMVPVRQGGGLFPVESERGILRWVAPLPDSVPIAGLYKWTLANEQGALNLKLVDLNGEAVFPSKSLVNDLVEFRVQLQGRTSGAWTERWDESELPQRVRLHIKTVAYGDWPPITVRIGGGL
jgi:prepilin-type N-terminal cleavage/methylation domain-containing protein